MGDIVKSIFAGFTDVITGLTDGIQTAFGHILWADPTAEVKVLSDLAQFGLIFMGVSMAIGLGYLALRLIKK